ncbi:hypothetical protein PIB30_093432 [Stylosanthes scabra]|uniref:Uncharacterized protein n=1 Tax=Stylosanthes scabra TaxID=79078 RepID=A0ABU6VVA8_9FABA|nr:hypothetical protein [Stylosanthes scabra]
MDKGEVDKGGEGMVLNGGEQLPAESPRNHCALARPLLRLRAHRATARYLCPIARWHRLLSDQVRSCLAPSRASERAPERASERAPERASERASERARTVPPCNPATARVALGRNSVTSVRPQAPDRGPHEPNFRLLWAPNHIVYLRVGAVSAKTLGSHSKATGNLHTPTTGDPRTTKVRRTARISMKLIKRRFYVRIVAKGVPSKVAPKEVEGIDISSDSEKDMSDDEAALELTAMDGAFNQEEEEEDDPREEEEDPRRTLKQTF